MRTKINASMLRAVFDHHVRVGIDFTIRIFFPSSNLLQRMAPELPPENSSGGRYVPTRIPNLPVGQLT